MSRPVTDSQEQNEFDEHRRQHQRYSSDADKDWTLKDKDKYKD